MTSFRGKLSRGIRHGSSCGSVHENWPATAVVQRERVFIGLESAYLLHRVEVGDLLAHDRASAGSLRHGAKLQMNLIARDGVVAAIVVAAARPQVGVAVGLELQRDGRGRRERLAVSRDGKLRQRPGCAAERRNLLARCG